MHRSNIHGRVWHPLPAADDVQRGHDDPSHITPITNVKSRMHFRETRLDDLSTFAESRIGDVGLVFSQWPATGPRVPKHGLRASPKPGRLRYTDVGR